MLAAQHDFLLLILCSPSGAGKTTLTRFLLAEFPELTFSVSHTTRAPRAGEADKEAYHFVSRQDFDALVERDAFAEWAEVHGNRYGTGVAELERAALEGKRGIIFDIDYQGARQIRSRFSNTVGVFVLPPTLAELRRRLEGRGSDDPAVIEKRLDKAKAEIEHYGMFEYLLVNRDLNEAKAVLSSIVRTELHRRKPNAAHGEALIREAKGLL